MAFLVVFEVLKSFKFLVTTISKVWRSLKVDYTNLTMFGSQQKPEETCKK